ncbi:MAG: efflux RND transporter periplasmic adaptor subunit [Gammaproteobacteria bacterium]
MDKHLAKRLVILAIFLIVLFGAIFGWRAFVNIKAQQALAQAPPRRVSVSTAPVKRMPWASEIQATATLQAIQGTPLTPQLAGIVTHIYFHSGDAVKKGQLLVQLNDSTQRAQRAHDAASLKLAKIKLTQQRELYSRHNASQLAFNSAEATYTQAKAALSADNATIAKLQIRAPFAGHLGLREVSLGQYVATTTTVVDLQQWNPIHAEFQVPQQDLNRLGTGQTVVLEMPGLPGANFSGKLTAIGAKVQPGTRNVRLEATLSNPDGKLRPGMYGEITLKTGHAVQALTVPESAITYNTYGSYVYVVEKGPKGSFAKERHVTTGASRNGRTVVTQGVKAGEQVVVAGQVKLHSGALVTIVKNAPGAGSAGTAAAAGQS